MQLHAFPVHLLLDEELRSGHVLDGLFELVRGAFAKHGSEGAEEMDIFILQCVLESTTL